MARDLPREAVCSGCDGHRTVPGGPPGHPAAGGEVPCPACGGTGRIPWRPRADADALLPGDPGAPDTPAGPAAPAQAADSAADAVLGPPAGRRLRLSAPARAAAPVGAATRAKPSARVALGAPDALPLRQAGTAPGERRRDTAAAEPAGAEGGAEPPPEPARPTGHAVPAGARPLRALDEAVRPLASADHDQDPFGDARGRVPRRPRVLGAAAGAVGPARTASCTPCSASARWTRAAWPRRAAAPPLHLGGAGPAPARTRTEANARARQRGPLGSSAARTRSSTSAPGVRAG
ncbi:hypothetical protein ACFONH_15490 [Streptomonospora nanhaiensis]|uniref:Uncharacterized protein n=1 Tax=Streptomonospora nanhaiensis TaxID=1323731 RepID=A0A853BSW8_9ACTN|nr:hypothetical protein [Streptomonospora nanhaiensis]